MERILALTVKSSGRDETAEYGDSSLNTTGPEGVKARGSSRNPPPHPPFGPLLPGGEKGTVLAIARRGYRRGGN
jgi:hypothetical protein